MLLLSSPKALSSVTAVILLIMITVASAIMLYLWLSGYMSTLSSTNEPKGSSLLKLEAIAFLKDEKIPNYVYGVKVYVMNIGDTVLHIANNSLYIVKAGNIVAAGTAIFFGKDFIELKPGETAEITYYLDSILKPGTYMFKIVTKEGIESVKIVKNKYLVGKSTIHNVTISNDVNNKVVSEDNYAIYESYYDAAESRLYFNITPLGVEISAARVELFNSTGQHPQYVSGNPWNYPSPFIYSNYAYWQPVYVEDLPAIVVYTIYIKD